MSKEGSVFDMGAGNSVPDWSEKRKPAAKPATGAQPQKPQAKAQPSRSVPVPAPQRTPSSPTPQKSQWQPTYHEAPSQIAKPAAARNNPPQPSGLPSPDRGTGTGGLPTTPPQQPRLPQQAQPTPTPQLPATPSLPAVQQPAPVPTPTPIPAPTPIPGPVTYTPTPTQEPTYQDYQQPAPPGLAPITTPQQIQQEWGPAPVPARPQHSRASEEDYEDFDDYDESETISKPRSKSSTKGKNSKGTKGKSKGRSNKNGKKDYDPGNKNKANVIRWVTLGLLGLLCVLGIYSIVFPTKFPAPDQVVSRVQEGLGMTDFPADRAEAFVVGFSRAYLTISTSGSGSQREAELSNYVPASLIDSLGSRSGGVDQYIVDGPYISGTRYVSDEDAVFTVASRMNNGYWIYLDIPVYYNHQTRAFAISGVPAVVAQPRLSSVPAAERAWEVEKDDALTAEVSSYLERYFKAWSTPDEPDTLNDLFTTANASPRAISPILGVEFVSLSGVEVSTSDGTTEGGQDVRQVSATVRWKIAPPVNEDEELTEQPDASTYNMMYEVILVRSPGEETQWRVSDIRGGIRTTTALSGGEVEEETEETE